MTDVEQQAVADAAKAKAEADALKKQIEELKKSGVKVYSEEDMKEAIARRQEALEKLRLREEADKKAEEDRLKKNGEVEKLLDAEKAAHLKTQQERDADKVLADKYREAHKKAIDTIKEKLGDKWDDNYASLPLESLTKLIGEESPLIPVATAKGKPTEKVDNPFSKKTLNLAKQIELKRTNPTLAAKLESEAEK